MNKYARFDEIPSRTLKDIKETKRHGRMDNVKTVYPPRNTVCGGYNTVCGGYNYGPVRNGEMQVVSVMCPKLSGQPWRPTVSSPP